jgi:hypothetical protein
MPTCLRPSTPPNLHIRVHACTRLCMLPSSTCAYMRTERSFLHPFVCAYTYKPVSLHTFMFPSLLMSIRSSIPTLLHTFMPPCLYAYMLAHTLECLQAFSLRTSMLPNLYAFSLQHDSIPSYAHSYAFSHLHTSIFTCLHVSVQVYMPPSLQMVTYVSMPLCF